MISANSSLKDFQDHNNVVYGVTNGRNYSAEKMFARLHSHTTRVLKVARKHEQDRPEREYSAEELQNFMYHLCMAFSWSLAMLNRYQIDLASDMWRRFPGVCPYCLDAPCCCKKRPKERQKLVGKARGGQPASLRDWQKMFAGIYPNIALLSAIHLSEEAGEVHEALLVHSDTHRDDCFWKVIEELVDLVTNIFGVANCLGLDLAKGMAEYFGSGCPKCRHLPCECGFVVSDEPAILKMA